MNNAFFNTNNYLIENISKVKHIPTTIVQGRYDVVCPARSAWDLHRAFPESELHIISDSGHAAGEPGIRSQLIKTTDLYKKY
jgi:proline iminopeptidase